jgi:S-formylglutathione hydrolase FrmB
MDSGRVSRRSLLIGAAGGAVVLGGGAAGFDYELDRHPGLRQRLFGCGGTPSVPRSAYDVGYATFASSAMKTNVGYAIATPHDRRPDEALPLILALPGEGGHDADFNRYVGLPGYASAAGVRACFVSPGDVNSTYYHPRADGTNMFACLVDELIPLVEQRHQVGGSRNRRATYGVSMGGFGALLIAQQRPDLICATVGSSPAVFPSYHAAITGHPHTFDSEADWEQWGVWTHASSMGGVPVRIDCGQSDPFASTARSLIQRIPGAVGEISSGCHQRSFWRRKVSAQLKFLDRHLT